MWRNSEFFNKNNYQLIIHLQLQIDSSNILIFWKSSDPFQNNLIVKYVLRKQKQDNTNKENEEEEEYSGCWEK